MRNREIISICLLLSLGLSSLGAQSAFITQVDSGGLLAIQRNRLYARFLDKAGRPVESPDPAALSVYESSDGSTYLPTGELRVLPGDNKTKGISFLFLMDNSGSMYDTLAGQPTAETKDTRYYAARKAAEDFLLSISGSEDTVGLASFNTRYRLLTPPAKDREEVARGLDGISKPVLSEAYTELYASLKAASGDLRGVKGRKALVVLSDGVNYPYLQYAKAPSPEYGKRVFTGDEALEEALRDGVTIFAVNFGPDPKDSMLADIAARSGGGVFDARNEAELSAIYQTIREKILAEALIEYKAKMLSGDKRYVKLEYKAGGASALSTALLLHGHRLREALRRRSRVDIPRRPARPPRVARPLADQVREAEPLGQPVPALRAGRGHEDQDVQRGRSDRDRRRYDGGHHDRRERRAREEPRDYREGPGHGQIHDPERECGPGKQPQGHAQGPRERRRHQLQRHYRRLRRRRAGEGLRPQEDETLSAG
jgi:hypothetical protein